MPTLHGVDLSKSYRGRKVVDNVELEIAQGEVVGPVGAKWRRGKTTTFYMIVGLARPDSGRVLLNEEEITDLPMFSTGPERHQLLATGAFGFPSTQQRKTTCSRFWKPCR